MRCESCGGETEYRQKDSCQGLFCENCDHWCVVTTYIPPIAKDMTIYSVYLLGAEYKNLKLIKEVSRVSGMNYLEVRKLLQQDKSLIFEGHASTVLYIINIMKSLAVNYEITPEYNW